MTDHTEALKRAEEFQRADICQLCAGFGIDGHNLNISKSLIIQHPFKPGGSRNAQALAFANDVIELVAENERLKAKCENLQFSLQSQERMTNLDVDQLRQDNKELRNAALLGGPTSLMVYENQQLKDRSQKLKDFVLKFRYNFQRQIDYANLYEEADDILGMGLYPFDEDIEDLYCEESNDE